MNIPDHIATAVADEFTRHYPEFYACAINAKLLSDAVDKYTEAGASFSVDTLANAYHHLQAAGALVQETPEVIELGPEEKLHQHDVAELSKIADMLPDSDFDKALQRLGVWVPMTGGRVWRE